MGDNEHLTTSCFFDQRDEDGVNFSVFGNLDVWDHEDCGSLFRSTRCRIGYFSESYDVVNKHSQLWFISTQ